MTAVCCSPFRGITTWWSARPTRRVERPSLEPRPLEEEIDFILRTADRYLSGRPRREDVLSVFAGLRPLAAPKSSGESTKEISRSHKIMVSGSNLITIIGGKWTTYRRMAQDTVDGPFRWDSLLGPAA